MSSRFVRYLIFLFVYIGAFSACTSEKPNIIPVSDFFSNPEKTTFRMSPSGKYLSYLSHHDDGNQLVLLDISGDEPVVIPKEIDVRNISNYQWSDEGEILFSVRFSDQDSVMVYALDVENGSAERLFEPTRGNIRFITPARKKNGGILATMNDRDSTVFDVYRVYTKGKRREMVARNPGNISRWYADLEGQLRLALAGDSIQEALLYRKSEQQPFKVVKQNPFYNSITPFGFIKGKPDHVYALSNIGRDKSSLVELDLSDGSENVLFSHPEVDVASGGYASESGEMVYAYSIHEHREREFLDKRFEDTYQKLARLLPGYELRVIDEDFSKQRVVVQAFKDTDPGLVCYFDGTSDRLVQLSEINPKLKNQKLATMRPISFEARDGLKIRGFLTVPMQSATKNLPVIVFPHSGPHERNYWAYHPEVQFFANRGYAVLQINYRGSTGYGKDFWMAGFQEWGGKIQDDITDGVKWLISEQIADPERIGIYGVGFGGYSALHAAVFRSDLYACAASYGGFSNLFTYIREVPPMLKPYLQKYYMIIGNPETDSERLKQMSPVFHAEKVRIPIFIAQGGKDSRSTANETNQFVNKIRRNNIPITYVLREDEGRAFRKEENRFLLYEELIQFFDVHLKNK